MRTKEGKKRLARSIIELKHKKGYYYEKWLKNWKEGIEKKLREVN